jgi:DNA-binding GntR family transcriptional regulator
LPASLADCIQYAIPFPRWCGLDQLIVRDQRTMETTTGFGTADFRLPNSLGQAVADHLGRAIAEGRLKPGQRLIEVQLCEEFGVSRTPLREALRVLAAEGLVEVSSRRGARVAELSAGSVGDVFAVRAALEGLAATLAAPRITQSDLVRLEELNVDMRAAVTGGEPGRFFTLNTEFHRLIASASGNDYLRSLLVTAATKSFRPLFLWGSGSSHLLDSSDDHARIAKALHRRAGDEARALMERHIANGREEALRLLEGSGRSSDEAIAG